MGKKLRIAIVGMGIGKPNGRALSAHPRGEVVALCDLDEVRMREFVTELPCGVKQYTDYKELCRDREVDAVFVGTPNQWHVPVALEAVRNDKHILVTKPLSDAEQPAKRLVEAAEKAGVVNMMSLSTRFSSDCLYLHAKMSEGFFGDLYYARARSVRRNGIPAWNLGFIQQGGGAFRDMGVHVLDAAWYLMGRPHPETVTGVAAAKFGPRGLGYSRPTPETVYRKFAVDDYGAGFVRFANGAGLQVESFWASHQPPEIQIELFGSDAGARLKPLMLYRNDGDIQQDLRPHLDSDSNPDAWSNIAEHFIGAVLDNLPCTAPLRQGLQVQQMMEALLKSAQTGREVVMRQYYGGDE